MPSSHEFGRESEQAAARFLGQAGYRIVARNYRDRFGEVDLIAYDGPTLVFVEVKARRTGRFGAPSEAVTLRKQTRLTKAAMRYLAASHAAEPPCRFDLVVIDASARPDAPRIELLKNIFSPEWRA